MNLKENYEKLFGKMDEFNHLGQKMKTKVKESVPLTESQTLKLQKINKYFNKQYNGSTLSVKNNQVTVNGVIVEDVTKFLGRSDSSIMTVLKNYANKTSIK